MDNSDPVIEIFKELQTFNGWYSNEEPQFKYIKNSIVIGIYSNPDLYKNNPNSEL